MIHDNCSSLELVSAHKIIYIITKLEIRSYLCLSNNLFYTAISVTFNVPENVKWIKVNAIQNGYYRVVYNDDNWASLIEELSNNPTRFSSEVSPLESCKSN